MHLTEIDPTVSNTTPDDDCIVVSLLSLDAQHRVQTLLTDLTEKLGNVIWPMPSTALHITLCEIIQPKEYAEDKQLLMSNIPEYEETLATLLKLPPVQITFDTIEVSPKAIIIRGKDDGTFNRIRSNLVRALPLPSETKSPPDIIHSTIARFVKEVDVSEVVDIVSKHQIRFNEVVREFQLLEHTAPHLVSYQLKKRFILD